jgi:purine-cytosine permease-like protein
MATFTAVMAADIYVFGEKMRTSHPEGYFFGPAGKVVLTLLAALLCMGWLLVGIHRG